MRHFRRFATNRNFVLTEASVPMPLACPDAIAATGVRFLSRSALRRYFWFKVNRTKMFHASAQ